MPARAVRPALLLVLALATGCTDDGPAPTAAPTPPAPAVTAAVTLPPDALLALVPTSGDVPPGLLPVVSGSGPRDLAAVAAFSADPAAAAAALRSHGFRRAYVAQYAEPGAEGRVLSVVVSEFATLPGGRGTLTTLRFRVGSRTWLLAYGAPDGGDEVVLALGRTLAERAAPA